MSDILSVSESQFCQWDIKHVFYIIEQTCLNSHILSNEMRGVENKDVTRNMRQKDDVLDQVEWVGGMMAG